VSQLAATQRRVMVVGASSGIGRATALRLAAQGARLVLASRSREVLEQVGRECTARGAQGVLVVPADIGDRADVEILFAEATERFGGLDAVVNSAAVVAYGRFHDVPPDVYDQVVRTNLIGTANVARCALQLFEPSRAGSLVIVGSVLAKIATPTMSSYVSSKAGVYGLARTLQVEARRIPGVNVSLVSPGSVDTPIYDQAATYTGRGGHPPPPVTSPDKVAEHVVRAIDHPQRDDNVGLGNAVMIAGFRLLPGVFDLLVGGLMSALGQGRTKIEEGPGNVFQPRPEREALRGRWPNLWG
jgi:short-subunit dehydrogenase